MNMKQKSAKSMLYDAVCILSYWQLQDKFRLDLTDEEAVQYMQTLIDESVGAVFAAMVETIHKFAQVNCCLSS